MRSTSKPGAVLCAAAFALPLLLAGCGMPSEPKAPSLELPVPVADLTASRTGNTVTLAWTMPKNDTSKVPLKLTEPVPVRVCRAEGSGTCSTAGEMNLLPGAKGTFTETLASPLAAGRPRTMSYFIELLNKRGRSAGMSNAATVLAGQAPSAIANLSAEVRRDGVALHWTPDSADGSSTAVRLVRKLVSPQADTKQKQNPLAPTAEPAEQNLLVTSSSVIGGALDSSAQFSPSYEYRAQRIVWFNAGDTKFELDGPLSPPVRIDVVNVFAPAVPEGLVAVAVPGTAPAIDLSWHPDTETWLAGYAVYRREGEGAWQKISGTQPVTGPGFHDANVLPGHSYEYAVTAIGTNGRESARSTPAQESVPEA